MRELSSSAADQTATASVYSIRHGRYARSMQVTVRVKPGSRKGPLVEQTADGLIVFVRERAADGAANAGVERALAAHFDVPPSRVRITHGRTSRIKRVLVDA
jgi:uncharacterized protein YggU (UPF0235/DUF167 family)